MAATINLKAQLGKTAGLQPRKSANALGPIGLCAGGRMATSDGYGQQLAERLRAEEAHTIVTRVLRTADMAVTESRCDDPVLGLSHSIQREDAYLVALTLRDFPNRQYWEDGRQMPVCDLRTGQVDFHALKRDPVALLDKPYHDLFFYLPRSALDAIADDGDAQRLGDLNTQPVTVDA